MKKQLQGEYISAGPESHFRVQKHTEPKKEEEPKPQPSIPEFNLEDLMKHEWKGKKLGEKEYGKGSLSWGWDFRENLSEQTIKIPAL